MTLESSDSVDVWRQSSPFRKGRRKYFLVLPRSLPCTPPPPGRGSRSIVQIQCPCGTFGALRLCIFHWQGTHSLHSLVTFHPPPSGGYWCRCVLIEWKCHCFLCNGGGMLCFAVLPSGSWNGSSLLSRDSHVLVTCQGKLGTECEHQPKRSIDSPFTQADPGLWSREDSLSLFPSKEYRWVPVNPKKKYQLKFLPITKFRIKCAD